MKEVSISINPATEERIAEYARQDEKATEARIAAAEKAWQSWRHSDIAQRAAVMQKAAILLEAGKERYARIITEEMGKAIHEAIGEVSKCAWLCRYYAEEAGKMLRPREVQTDAQKSYVCYQPLGLILGVMPWNFPFWQVFRFAVPALMAGNGALLKHASNVQGCALAIEEIFGQAGLPKGLFSNLNIAGSKVESVIADARIAGVSLTGSEPAGSAVAAAAGRHIKKSLLELGGSDPYLILEDADLSLAANACTAGRLLNAGQSCIGAKRFIVLEDVYDIFVKLFSRSMAAAHMGDPLKKDTTLGPLARMDLREQLQAQVQASIDMGAKAVLGGHPVEGKGFYYPPTVLIDVTPEMPAFKEELFGPVAAIIKAQTEAEAVALANRSEFGLGAGVFTNDLLRGERIALQLEAGSCFVNGFVKSDPRLPFGGIKKSGYGRELSREGLLEFVNIKTVYIH